MNSQLPSEIDKALAILRQHTDCYSSDNVEKSVDAIEAYIRSLIKAGDYMAEYVSDRRRLIWADVKNEPTKTN